MLSEAEIKAYRIRLEYLMRNHHNARMTAMDKKRYFEMEDHAHAFDRTVARIDTIDKILQKH